MHSQEHDNHERRIKREHSEPIIPLEPRKRRKQIHEIKTRRVKEQECQQAVIAGLRDEFYAEDALGVYTSAARAMEHPRPSRTLLHPLRDPLQRKEGIAPIEYPDETHIEINFDKMVLGITTPTRHVWHRYVVLTGSLT